MSGATVWAVCISILLRRSYLIRTYKQDGRPSPPNRILPQRRGLLPGDASMRINYIPSPIIFIMRREQPCNLVDLISEHVRDMEMERIRARQEKYLEANH